MKRNEIESLVGDPLNPGNAETAARVWTDATLWPAVEATLYPDTKPTEEERLVISRVVAERCGESSRRRQAWLRNFVATRLDRISGSVGDFALAASAAGAKRQDAASPEAETVTFVFVSDASSEADASRAWRAEMTLPSDASVDEMLPIAVADGRGSPAATGVFKVAGISLPVRGGRAEIPYGMFLSGLKDAQVEFTDARGVRSPGTLALF